MREDFTKSRARCRQGVAEGRTRGAAVHPRPEELGEGGRPGAQPDRRDHDADGVVLALRRGARRARRKPDPRRETVHVRRPGAASTWTTIYTFLFSGQGDRRRQGAGTAPSTTRSRAAVAQEATVKPSHWGSSSRSTCRRPRSRPAAGRRGKRGSVRPVGPVASSATSAPAATASSRGRQPESRGSRSPGCGIRSSSPRRTSDSPGIVAFVALWYLLTEFFAIPRFNKLPGPVEVWREFTSRTPTYRHLAVHARLLQAHPVERLAGYPGVLLGDGARRAARPLHGLEEGIPGLHVPDRRARCDRSRCSPGCRLRS